jgi:hypothetical protein
VARQKEPLNPFYIALVALGVVFLVTACAYGVMAYRAIAPARANVEPHPLTEFLDRNGVAVLAWELALLAVATFAAMALDRWRSARQEATANREATADEQKNRGGNHSP